MRRIRLSPGGAFLTRRAALLLLACAPAVLGAASERLPKLTVERIGASPPLSGDVPSGLAWHRDGRRLTYVRRSGESASLCAFDVTRGAQVLLLDDSRLTIPGETARPLRLGRSWSWLADGRTLLVPAAGDIFTVDVASGAVRALVRTPEKEEYPEASPDGRRVAFVRGNDLYVVEVASGRETRLTHGGSETLLNGRLDWVYEEELASRSGEGFAWSPDSQAIAYLQLDQARVSRFPIVDFMPVHNEVSWQRYPTPGTPNAAVRLGVVGIERDGSAGPERLAAAPANDGYLLPQLAWTQDSRGLAFEQMNRAQNELELRLLPVPASARDPLGPPRTVLAERSKTWVNTFVAPRFLRDGRRFVWLSERDGFAHLYLCDLGGACRAITQGPWMVDAQVSFAGATPGLTIDERSGFVYFTATEKDPRERHLYRVRLDGTGRARLTREDGTHRTLVSPDGRFYADTWSDAATPPKVWIASQDGTRRFTVEENARPPILGFERGAVEFVELKAADGTPLYASLLKPADFDAKTKHPVVVTVYGGPHVQQVTKAWSRAAGFDQLLASRGFLVWRLDNRGSAGRGAAFEAPIFHDLGRVELEDQLVGVEYLESLPYVDAARIGITGWSYGGYMTLYAATHAPEVFRAAVAGAPVTDWRNYDTIYTERYMGTPGTNPKGYETSSTLPLAGQLKTDLLIVHGTDDDNVHLSNSIEFVAALLKAGRSAGLELHPGQKHGFSAREDQLARDRAILSHFERTLKP